MNQKNVLLISFISLLLFSACSEEDKTFDNKVFINLGVIPTNEINANIITDYVNGTTTIDGKEVLEFPIKSTLPVEGDVKMEAVVSDELLEVYNEANGTDYSLMDSKFVEFTNSVCTIKNGEMSSNDFISVKVSVPNGVNFTDKDAAILPVMMERVSGNAEASTKRAVIYLKFSKANDYRFTKQQYAYIVNDHINDQIAYEPSEEFGFSVESKAFSDEAVTIKAVFDSELVSAYNEKNETDYLPLDEKFISLTSETCTIESGAQISSSKIMLKFNNGSDYDVEGFSLLPIRLEVTKAGKVLSTNENSYYLIVGKKDRYIEVTKTVFEGSKLDRTGWTASGSAYGGFSVQNILNGNFTSTWFSGRNPDPIIIDMKSNKTVKGIALAPDYGKYSGYSSFKGMELLLSVDGSEWKSVGACELENKTGSADEPDWSYLRFKASEAQYIKIVPTSSYRNYFGLSEVEVYE